MGYSEAFKLQVVAEYEQGNISAQQLQNKYKIPGNSTISKWVKQYGKSGSDTLTTASDITEKLEAIALKKELEKARIKIAALEALVEASSEHTGINLKKKFGGKL